MTLASVRWAYASIAVAVVAWVYLLIGFAYASVEPPPSPNPVIMFAAGGLTRLVTELASFAIGCVGLLVAAVAVVRGPRDRMLATAVFGNAAVCVVCAAMALS